MTVNIRVFDVEDIVREEELNQKSKINISILFDKIFSTRNTAHSKISCTANNESILKTYSNDPKYFSLENFAKSLCDSEKKKDGTRNKQITPGYLFIKQEHTKLTLLKLENIEIVDKKNDFELDKNFSTEAKYYKGCIFDKSITDIVIIDKNTSVARFWKDDFLNLSLNRDDYTNSVDLIDLLESDQLFSEKIYEKENFKSIKVKTENFMFNHINFSKNDLYEFLIKEKMITDTHFADIYSEKSKELDTNFLISSKVLNKKYKKVIKVSKNTKIVTNNYTQLYREEGIEYKDGKIILSISDDLISQLPKELLDDNNR